MLKKIVSVVVAIFLFSTAYAEPAPENVAKTILETLRDARPDLNYGGVEVSPIDGLYIVRIDGTQFIYVNETGEYLITGNMYQARPGLFIPVKDLAAARIRKALISAVPRDETIVFPAVDETRAVVHVFTDVDCGYCQKIHNEAVPALNMNGVEVRYLAFPRAGVGSASYRKIASAWCADEPQEALTALKNRQPIAENVCKDNPVAAHYKLGREVGVTGTPALVMEDGALLPGYRPAPELLKVMGLN